MNMSSGYARAQTDDCNSSHFGPKIIKEIKKLKELSATSRKYSSSSTFPYGTAVQSVSQLRWWWKALDCHSFTGFPQHYS